MVKAKTVAAKPAAPVEEAPRPRLVGDEAPPEDAGDDEQLSGDVAIAQLASLTAALSARPGFVMQDGETDVDAALRVIAELDAELATAAETIAALTADPAQAAAREAKRAHAKAAKNEVAVLADLPDTASLTLRFAEDEDKFIPTLPARAIERSQLSAFGGRGVLEIDIDFGPDSPPALIRSAWLIAGSKSVKCEISGGIRVGGGNIVKIPKGHLIF